MCKYIKHDQGVGGVRAVHCPEAGQLWVAQACLSTVQNNASGGGWGGGGGGGVVHTY